MKEKSEKLEPTEHDDVIGLLTRGSERWRGQPDRLRYQTPSCPRKRKRPSPKEVANEFIESTKDARTNRGKQVLF